MEHFFKVKKLTKVEYHWDSENQKGFGVRHNLDGSRSYVFKCEYKDPAIKTPKVWNVTLGSVDSLTQDKARELAKNMWILAKAGKDPRILVQTSGVYVKCITLKQLCSLYMEKYSKPFKKSWRHDLARLRYFQSIEHMHLDQITSEHVSRLHLKIGAKAPTVANRVKEQLHHMFEKAREWKEIPQMHPNPASGLPKFPEYSRDRVVEDYEFPALMAVLETWPDRQAVAIVKLAILCALRSGELLFMKWTDVHLDQGFIRMNGRKLKNGKTHTLALPARAIEIFRELPRKEGNPWVFPGRRKGTKRRRIDDEWREIRSMCGLDDVVFHSLRHTAASKLLEQYGNLKLVGEVLNQTNQNVTWRYSHIAKKSLKNKMDDYGESLREMGL